MQINFKANKKSPCNQILHYLFYYWDGTEFFGFDEAKIYRFTPGNKAKCRDKICVSKYIFPRLILIFIFFFVF